MKWILLLERNPGAPRGAPGRGLLETGLLAGGRQLAGADLLLLGEVRLTEVLADVVLGDRDRLQEHRRDVLRLVIDGVRGRGRLTLGQPDRQLRGRVGLLLDRLVDRHALVAGDDVLDALQRRVLTR